MKHSWRFVRSVLFVGIGFGIGYHAYSHLHSDCLKLGDKLPPLHLRAGEEIPRLCACNLPAGVLLPVEVYTYGEDGKPLPESPQPREAYFKVKHHSLWHNKLVFFRWKDEKGSPEDEE